MSEYVIARFNSNWVDEFENGQEVLDSIELEDISEERARVICDTIGDSFGLVTLEDVYENIGDDLEELDENAEVENSEASSDIVFGMIPVEHPTLLTVYKVSPNKIGLQIDVNGNKLNATIDDDYRLYDLQIEDAFYELFGDYELVGDEAPLIETLRNTIFGYKDASLKFRLLDETSQNIAILVRG